MAVNEIVKLLSLSQKFVWCKNWKMPFSLRSQDTIRHVRYDMREPRATGEGFCLRASIGVLFPILGLGIWIVKKPTCCFSTRFFHCLSNFLSRRLDLAFRLFLEA